MAVTVRGLSKTFQSSRGQMVRAVDDLALTVEDREFLVILGPSGSGKTTLLRCIAGLERADAGAISIDGRMVYSSAEKVWIPPERRGISMVFQSYALWPHMTAFENVAYPLRACGIGGDDLRARVTKAPRSLGAGHWSGAIRPS
ncbi:MAG: ABC transporter ATP-binding protein [Betaproteobacteria bacterium]|nr:ABC transporter ATP-binding protein [Betaproteobacteria bacterium]